MEKNKQQILLEAIKNSIEIIFDNESTKSYEQLSIWDTFKNTGLFTKGTLLSFFKLSDKELNKLKNAHHPIYLFSKKYEQSDFEKLEDKINKIIYFCYRRNFPPIKSKSGSLYTSDSGWGCMLRCSQMILARGIYKIFRKVGYSPKHASYSALIYFQESPFSIEEIPDEMIPVMNKILKEIFLHASIADKKEITIKKILAPFSIGNICKIGELFDKTAGEWFSDVSLVNIYDLINRDFGVLCYLEILTFQSSLNFSKVLERCFSSKEEQAPNKENFIERNGQKYYFRKSGIIFVSVRLGIDDISKEYLSSIKKLFSCKECLGIIGGKRSQAYYFIGYREKEILYLDPHTVRECCLNINSKAANFLVAASNYILDAYLTSLYRIALSPTFCFHKKKN